MFRSLAMRFKALFPNPAFGYVPIGEIVKALAGIVKRGKAYALNLFVDNVNILGLGQKQSRYFLFQKRVEFLIFLVADIYVSRGSAFRDQLVRLWAVIAG